MREFPVRLGREISLQAVDSRMALSGVCRSGAGGLAISLYSDLREFAARLTLRPLEFAGPARHGVVPQLLAILVKDQLGVLGCGEPVAPGELAFQLARSPAGIAEREEALFRTPVAADVAQDLSARRHRHASVDRQGLLAPIFGTVHDKTQFRL